MSIVQPSKERLSFQNDGVLLKIIVPSQKNSSAMFFLCFWLLGWTVGEIIVGRMLVASFTDFFINFPEIDKVDMAGVSVIDIFMLAWFVSWTISGAFAFYNLFWQLAGKETIEIGYDSIKIQRTIFGIGKTKEFMATHLKNLRILLTKEDNIFGWTRASSFWGTSGGLLAFDYNSKTFHFGGASVESEAKQILEKIIARFPQIGVYK